MANILIIDDDDLVRESVSITLEDDGHNVTLARNGLEGIQMLEQQSYDLIITDIFMPEKDGFEILIEVRNKSESQKVLIISGGGRKADIDVILKQGDILGANDTLEKPFSIDDLRDKVSNLLDG